MSKKEINLEIPDRVEHPEPIENWHNKSKSEEMVNNKEWVEDNRPDEVADSIMEKINSADFKEHEIQPVIECIRRGDTASAAGKLNGLVKIELTSKEKKHFSELSPEIVLSWFKEYIEDNKEEELVEEEIN